MLEEVLLRQAVRSGGQLRVLEWGCGLSTLHFPAWLAQHDVQVSWLSLEHDRELFRNLLEPLLRRRGARIVWSEQAQGPEGLRRHDQVGVTALVFAHGPMNPFDGSPTRYLDRAKNLDDYVTLPSVLGLRFDAVIVDGRKRRRCLLQAAGLLAPGGIALLHDAQRPYYECAMSAFRSGRRIGDEFWIGAQEEADFADVVPSRALAARGTRYIPGA